VGSSPTVLNVSPVTTRTCGECRFGERCKTSIEQFPKLRNYKDLWKRNRARGSKIGQFTGITTRPAIRDKLLERPTEVGTEDNHVHRQSEPEKTARRLSIAIAEPPKNIGKIGGYCNGNAEKSEIGRTSVATGNVKTGGVEKRFTGCHVLPITKSNRVLVIPRKRSHGASRGAFRICGGRSIADRDACLNTHGNSVPCKKVFVSTIIPLTSLTLGVAAILGSDFVDLGKPGILTQRPEIIPTSRFQYRP